MKKIKALVLSLLSLSVVGAFSGCSFEALLGMVGNSSESTPTNSESSTPEESTPEESTPDESTPDDGGDVVDPTPEGPATPVSGDGSEYDPYVIEAGKTYVASNYHAIDEFDMDIWTNNYVITSAVNGTYTFNLLEDLNEYDVEVQIQGVTIPLDEENDYKQMADGFSFSVAAGVEVKFTVSSACWDSWPATYYDVNFSVDFDANTYEADGSALAPITLENGATYTVGASNAYYNFTAPSAGYYKLTVNADWSVVADGFNFYDADSNALLRGAAVEIAEGETIAFYAANYISEGWDTIPTSWTFTFGADVANDENFDTPAVLGSYETPLEIYLTGDYEITIPAAENAYYVVLCDAFQFVVPTGTVAEVDYEITDSGNVVAFANYNMMWNSQLLVCFHIADRTATEDLTVSFTVTDYVAEDGGDDVEGNYIEVTTTDTYGFFDLYSFTAEAAGTYTFTVPAGLGFTSKAAYDAWDAPEVDFYANESGDDVTVTLAAGETYEFYVGSLIKGDWIITWTVGEAGEGEGEGEEVSLVLVNGENTVVITAEDIASEAQGALYTYTATADGSYTFKSNSAGAKIYDANMMYIGNGSAILTAGETYTILVWSPMGAGTYTLTIEAPVVEEGGDEEGGDEVVDTVLEVGANTVTITDENVSVATGVAYTFTPDANGTCQFKGNLMCVVFDADWNELSKTSGKYTLEAGVEYNVVIYTMMVSFYGAGDYTITVDFEAIVEESGEGDGSLANPFAIDDIFAEPLVVAANATTQIYYTFTLTEAATITLTFDNADTWFSVDNTVDNKRVVGGRLTDSYTGNFEAGTYIMAIGTWNTPELTLTLTCTKA